MNVIELAPVWLFGFGTCYLWQCYRKQYKGIFTGGEIDLTRKSRLK